MSKISNSIKIGDMVNAIMDSLNEYQNLCGEQVRAAAKEVAGDAVKELKSTSPKGRGSKKGHYEGGWTYATDKSSAYKSNFTIHNAKKPGLAHLLEKGHAKRGGGRTGGTPHIEPVELHAIEEFENRLKERLET